MAFSRALILLAQDQVSAFFKVTMAAPSIVALVVAPISCPMVQRLGQLAQRHQVFCYAIRSFPWWHSGRR